MCTRRCPFEEVQVQSSAKATNASSRPHQHKQQRQRCVYGYVGTFDDAIKPLLLVYLIGSCLGTLFFAVFSQDATRSFVLSTCGHLLPEVVLWTHMIFPPATNRDNQKWMWGIRGIYLVGLVVFLFGPVNGNHKIGPFVTATYMILSGVSDFLALWLGLLMATRRTHHGARRLGLAFMVHGAAFHLNAYEFFANDATGTVLWGSNLLPWNLNLYGLSWFLLLLGTVAAFLTIPPLFKEPLDLRHQAPSPKERRFLAGGVLTSFLLIPPLSNSDPNQAFLKILADPTFLPKDPRLLLPYKIGFPLLSLILCVYILIHYVDSGVPMLPLPLTIQDHEQRQQEKQMKLFVKQ